MTNQLPTPKEITMRRFIGYRPNPPDDYRERGVAAPPDEPQYEGVVFTDGSVALRWRTAFRSTSVWACYEDFFQVHGHPEYGTRIEWLEDGIGAPAVAVIDPDDPIIDPCSCHPTEVVHQRGSEAFCLDRLGSAS